MGRMVAQYGAGSEVRQDEWSGVRELRNKG